MSSTDLKKLAAGIVAGIALNLIGASPAVATRRTTGASATAVTAVSASAAATAKRDSTIA